MRRRKEEKQKRKEGSMGKESTEGEESAEDDHQKQYEESLIRLISLKYTYLGPLWPC